MLDIAQRDAIDASNEISIIQQRLDDSMAVVTGLVFQISDMELAFARLDVHALNEFISQIRSEMEQFSAYTGDVLEEVEQLKHAWELVDISQLVMLDGNQIIMGSKTFTQRLFYKTTAPFNFEDHIYL